MHSQNLHHQNLHTQPIHHHKLHSPHSLLEERRLENLYRYSVLDTADEPAFHQIADDLGFTLQMPTVMINFVDRERVWFKTCVQVEDLIQAPEAPRQVAFCGYTILSDGVLVIEDMLEDERFRQNPLVVSGPQIRSYAGVPLITPEGFRIGTICCMDTRPHQFTARDLDHLRRAGLRVMSELDQRLLRTEYAQVMQQLQTLMTASPSGFMLLTSQHQVVGLNPAVSTITGQEWQIGESWQEDRLKLDQARSVFEPIYHREVGQGWFTVTRIPMTEQGRILLVFEDISDHIQHQTSLTEMAYSDPLTGLCNRNQFYNVLENSLDQPDLAVGFLDLDGFKGVNDTFGHHAGDALLKEVGQRLKAAVRQEDRVFRLAGDEFTLILRGDVQEDTLHCIAGRVMEGLQQPFLFEGQPVPFGVSLGLTRPQPGDTADTLLTRADRLMYQVKRSGKNHHRIG